MEETFAYDDMNRLMGITMKWPSGQDLNCSVTYDAQGRMTSKQAVTTANGTPQVTTTFSLPSFDATKVHAMAQAQTSSELFSSAAQTLTYTGFDKVRTLKQGNDSIRFTYGYDHQRIRMQELNLGTNRAKDYVGSCEFITESVMGGTDTKSLTYLSGPYGVFAVVERHNGTDALHYILKDNLGSWVTITNEYGLVEQQMSFDAWGNRRDPQTWANYTTNDPVEEPMFDRGFTGHEHLYDFGLINMNGRMYDPVMSSFLSVDQYVQTPENAQSFNRYAYCSNNPLKYVDPSGWLQVGGQWGYSSNPSANDPYAYIENRPLEPRDLGLRQLPQSDLDVVWMEGSDLRGGGGGGGIIGGWYKDCDGSIKYGANITSSTLNHGQDFLGPTFTSIDGTTYYGLFGKTYDLNSEEGRLGKDIDEAFINYVEYSQALLKDSFIYNWDGSNEPTEKTTDFGNVIYFDKNNYIKEYYYNNILVILIVCSTSQPYPENNMHAVFCGWDSAYPTRFINGERIEIGPVSIAYSFSQTTSFGKGYPLYFRPIGNDNARAILFFKDTQTRNSFHQQWNHVFGY